MVQVEIYKGFEMSVVYPPTSLLEQRRCILDNIDPVRSNGQNRKIKIQTVTTPQITEAPQVSPIKIQIIHWHYCRIIVIKTVKVKVNMTLVVGLINNDDIKIL